MTEITERADVERILHDPAFVGFLQTAYARLHAARRLVLGAFESQEAP